ncbi:MAG: OmpA family protein [Cyanobacteria bacterium]|nr:OmpA family protein [Cyanobacteriota bacterium]
METSGGKDSRMNRTVIAIVLISLVAAMCVGIYFLIKSGLNEKRDQSVSDARVNLTVRMAGDGYLGYFFINSPEMKRQAVNRGLAVNFTNDGGAYADRLEKFAAGQYDGIVLPVNSYLEHGLKYKYPGVIVAAIAESKGADAIVGFADKLPNGKISDLNNSNLKIVYTGQSPSSFLLDLTIVDFDLFNLSSTNTWRKEVGGSSDVLKEAKAKAGDVFVMWEPDVSRALKEVPGLKEVWGSNGFRGYIVDVFVFRRDFVSAHKDDLVKFFEAYFSSMRAYANDRSRLIEDMKIATNLKDDEIESMLKEIDWYDLQENAVEEFGIASGESSKSKDGVVNTIIACTNILLKTGKLTKDPLSDPYSIINSQIIKQVQEGLPATVGKTKEKHTFAELSSDDWKSLKEVGAMRVEPISFQSSSATLNDQGVIEVDKIRDLLRNNYPDNRIVVRGHTGAGSDESESVKLSQARAQAVVDRLVAAGLEKTRLRAEGVGSSQPPAKRPGENQRAYMYRMPRVEFVLLVDNSL